MRTATATATATASANRLSLRNKSTWLFSAGAGAGKSVRAPEVSRVSYAWGVANDVRAGVQLSGIEPHVALKS